MKKAAAATTEKPAKPAKAAAAPVADEPKAKVAKVKAAAPAKKASPKAAAKAAKPVKPEKADKVEKAAKPEKPVKAPKAKLVRDSFTMPAAEFAQVAELKARALGFQRETRKSELLRAGLAVLTKLSDAQLKQALLALPPLKAGRPKKDEA
nr:hypothetical protein [Aquabacterium sp.]